MSRYTVPTLDDVNDTEARQTLETIKNQVGMLPNLYAYEAHSPKAFLHNLNFAHAVEKAHFSNREAQAIYLATSEVNGCTYCLSAHTALAKMNGFTEEETFGLRAGSIEDDRLRILTRLTRAFVETRGKPDASLVDAFFDAGFTQAHLVDLVGLISVKTFSNYLHNTTKIPVDFPEAKPLPAELLA